MPLHDAKCLVINARLFKAKQDLTSSKSTIQSFIQANSTLQSNITNSSGGSGFKIILVICLTILFFLLFILIFKLIKFFGKKKKTFVNRHTSTYKFNNIEPRKETKKYTNDYELEQIVVDETDVSNFQCVV